MWLYTFVFDYNITLLVCGVLVGESGTVAQISEEEQQGPRRTNWFADRARR
jgi:hypothetical protein